MDHAAPVSLVQEFEVCFDLRVKVEVSLAERRDSR